MTSAIFVNPGSDFRLLSPTDAGDDTIGETYLTDPDGNTRGADGVWDRGAFEYGVSTSTGITGIILQGGSIQ